MIINLFAGLLGLLFVALAKMSSLQKDFRVANQPFVFKKFVAGEWIGWMMSFVFILIMAITLPEWIAIKEETENYIRILFVMGGAIGSWAFMLFLGKSKKFIRSKIDDKTNELDSMKIDTSNFPDTSAIPKIQKP
jgi:hypothetical protein